MVAKYDPWQIEVRGSTTDSRSKPPSFYINVGHKIVYSQDVTSKETNVEIFSKGNCIAQLEYSGTGDIKKFYLYTYDRDNNVTYTYVDTNGDGLFDFFLAYNPPGGNISNVSLFVRSNFTWIHPQRISEPSTPIIAR